MSAGTVPCPCPMIHNLKWVFKPPQIWLQSSAGPLQLHNHILMHPMRANFTTTSLWYIYQRSPYPIYSNPKLYILSKIFKILKIRKSLIFSFRTAVQLTHRLSSMQMARTIKFDSKSKCLDLKDKTKAMFGFIVLSVSVAKIVKK